MKCRNCSKDIPDGFTDCPWCGEPHTPNVLAAFNINASPSPTTSGPYAAAVAPPPPTNPVLVWSVFAFSFLVVTFAAIGATVRKRGELSWETSATFFGAWAAPYILSALLVLGFYLITRQKAHDSTKLLFASWGATILAVLSIFGSRNFAQPPPHSTAAASVQPPAVAKPAHTPTIWDPAVTALFSDIRSRNDAYLAEISQLDLGAHSLYIASSFRDAATIQQILVQLGKRDAIAQKYSSWDAIAAKVPAYVGSINASDNDKRKFLAAFTPAVQQMIDQRNAASRIEREWLRSTVELYRFMLDHQGTYTVSADGQQGTFLKPGLDGQFNAKLKQSAKLKQQFVQASAAFQASQRSTRAQMGLDP